jgi:SAM-dependent methyltransferase
LTPADQFFRALVLEARGDYRAARIAEETANQGLYAPEYLSCWESQVDYVVEQFSPMDGPIVDLASGRGYLVEALARRLKRPVVATDFSPGVLRRDRRWLESNGLSDRVSLLAFDARRTPFKAGSVATLTTNLGLPNIAEPGSLLRELRRIVAGVFVAISHFYPEDDEANARAIREAKLDTLLYRRTALQQYVEAGWEVEVKDACVGRALPTPPSMVLKGACVDGLPVADTNLEWCVLWGTSKVSHSKHLEVSQ